MAEEKSKEQTIAEALISAAIETIKNLLNVETDDDGQLKSFKLIKEGKDGTFYEFEVKVHPEAEAENQENKDSKKKKEKKKK